MRHATLVVALAAAPLGACGDSGGDAPAPRAGAELAADLRVTVRPAGPDGREQVRRITCRTVGEDATESRCRRLGKLTAQELDPVPPRTACAQIYGGPATARVTGEIRGARVDAGFNLTDACEIARWKRNAALLGPPPRRAG